MPELPEVETIRRDLETLLTRRRITRFEVQDTRFLSPQKTKQWATLLQGQLIEAFGRKGKYLWLTCSNRYRLVIHLRMTGQLIVGSHPSKSLPRMRLTFESGETLSLFDQRRFAEGWLLAPEEELRSGNPLGPDALNDLDHSLFAQTIKGRTTAIQPLLLDQRRIAGIGNIYAQEALFKALIRPTRPSRRISAKESTVLFEALKETLETAITHRGSTSRNYTDGRGAKGSAQTLHAVYQKGGQPCPRCHSVLRTVRVGCRGSVFCPRCQK